MGAKHRGDQTMQSEIPRLLRQTVHCHPEVCIKSGGRATSSIPASHLLAHRTHPQSLGTWTVRGPFPHTVRKEKTTHRGLGLCHVLPLHFTQTRVGVLQQLLNVLSVSLLKIKLFLLHFGHSIVELRSERKKWTLSSLL